MGASTVSFKNSMIYLIISDVHANFEALQAVLADAGEYDAAICLGDLVGYGPNPNECVEAIRKLKDLTSLAGNHDLAALDRIDLSQFNAYARYSAEWTARNLNPDTRAFLLSLPSKMSLERFYAAHASPRDPVWEYMEAEDQGPPNFRLFSEPFCLVGHTHVPRTFAERSDSTSSIELPDAGTTTSIKDGPRKIINPGSVGQPRNGDSRAAYGILDMATGQFGFRRVAYPYTITQAKIRDEGLPALLSDRLAHGL